MKIFTPKNFYTPEQVGGQMSANYIAIARGSTIRQAMSELVRQAGENDNIATLYVVEKDGTFHGAVDLKDLILAREHDSLEAITRTDYPVVPAREAVETAMEWVTDYSEDSFPVVDEDRRLVGVLTAPHVTHLMEAEMEEDYAMLGGLTAQEDLQEPVVKSVKKRLPWLVILLGLGMFVSSVVGAFEHVVAALPLIVCFQSLILDMAGNVGTQSLAVTIRVLMDPQVTGKEKLRLLGKEARVGLLNGLILGILSFVVIGGYLLIRGEALGVVLTVCLSTGIALLASMVISSITGTAVPIVFKKCGLDPAAASGPLITTLNDLTAVCAYYGIAWVLLHLIVL